MSDREPTPPYRWEAFVHWANLGLIAAMGVAGAVFDPIVWMAILPVEAGLLWTLPDLAPFRGAVDEKHRRVRVQTERAYFLTQLWGLAPRAPLGPLDALRSLLVEDDRDDLDQRVVERGEDFETYAEMRDIVRRLAEMVPLESSRVGDADIARLEEAVNGWLRILLACRPIARAVATIDEAAVARELAGVEAQLAAATGPTRSALAERKRLLEAQVARAPKLRATLELLRARAQAIPHQLRNLHAQVLTDPAKDVQSALDDMVERRDLLADALSDLEGDGNLSEALAELASARTAPKGAAAARARVPAR